MTGLRVAIAGAGLGGLCLAQGLTKAGIEADVYERDGALDTRRQGYRLHVDSRAGLALQDCLPPELFDLFMATTGRPSTQFSVLSSKLRVLHETHGRPDLDPAAAETLSTSVNRQTLREILASRLGDRIHFGSELDSFEQDDDRVVIQFAGGEETTADVLVGADGTGSATRWQYLPQADMIDSGSRCI
jgi:2-polyprenyl-6-methoxyphenol hydroxylase-like FAD-dependent oxidoreductase